MLPQSARKTLDYSRKRTAREDVSCACMQCSPHGSLAKTFGSNQYTEIQWLVDS